MEYIPNKVPPSSERLRHELPSPVGKTPIDDHTIETEPHVNARSPRVERLNVIASRLVTNRERQAIPLPADDLDLANENWFEKTEARVSRNTKDRSQLTAEEANKFLQQHSKRFALRGTPAEKKLIKTWLLQILMTKPGSKLLRQFVKRKGSVEISLTKEEGTSTQAGVIKINVALDTFILGVTKSGQWVAVPSDYYAMLFHELVHAYRDRLRELRHPKAGIVCALYHRLFHFLEEQAVMFGIPDIKAISENAFRCSIGQSFIRFAHLSFYYPVGKRPGLAQLSCLYFDDSQVDELMRVEPDVATKNVEAYLEDGSLIRARLASIAIYRKNPVVAKRIVEITEFNVHELDDLGSAFYLVLQQKKEVLGPDLLNALEARRGNQPSKGVIYAMWSDYLISRASGNKPAYYLKDLEETFENARSAAVTVLQQLYLNESSPKFDREFIEVAEDCARHFSEIKSQMFSLCDRFDQFGDLSAENPDLFQYLFDVDIKAMFVEAIKYSQQDIDELVQEEIIIRSSNLDIEQFLNEAIQPIAIDLDSDNLRSQYSIEEIAEYVTTYSEENLDEELAKGTASFTKLLKEAWLPAIFARHAIKQFQK